MNNTRIDEDIIHFLHNELLRRKEINPYYSLRSFALFLDVSPASLSQILRGKRKLASPTRSKIIKKLKLDDIISTSNSLKYSPLESSKFNVISRWYYDAILECTKFEDFKATEKWISRKLKIPLNQASEALKTLKKLKLLIKNEANGRWIDNTSGHTTHIQEGLTSQAKQNYQEDLLKLSQDSLLNDSIEVRNHTSMMVSIKKEDFNKAKQLIKKFRREFANILDVPKKPDEVYELCINFFPLTSNNKENIQ